jgi:hypothetical protein
LKEIHAFDQSKIVNTDIEEVKIGEGANNKKLKVFEVIMLAFNLQKNHDMSWYLHFGVLTHVIGKSRHFNEF